MAKTNPGRFFEDYSIGQVIEHALLRLGKEEDGETVGLELMKEERR